MTRLIAPDKGLKETSVGRKSYRPDKNGVYNVASKADAKLMKSEGFFEASTSGTLTTASGFPCECGFSSLFKKCGKCGKVNERD